jgi:ATP-binding cassette subfamily C protein LapB
MGRQSEHRILWRKLEKPADRVSAPAIGWTVVSATLSLNLLAMAMPLVVLQIFDRVIPFQAFETLQFLFIGMCVVALLELSLKCARVLLLGAAGEQFETDLTERFIAQTLNAESAYYQKITPAAHLDRFSAISQLRSFYAGQGRILAIDLPFATVFIAMIGLIGGWLIIIPLLSIVILFLFKVILQHAQSVIFEKRKILDGRRYSFLFEVLSQVTSIKANTMEPQMLRRYELLQQQTVDISHSIIHFSGFSQSFGALFSQLAVAAMGLLGGFLIISQQIGIAELAACMLLNGRTVQPLLKALNLWVQTENLSASREKIQETLETPQRSDVPNLPSILRGYIRFESVSPKRSGQSRAPRVSVDTKIPAGQFVAIIGPDGAGRSEMLKLILAESRPQRGRVLIDGRPAKTYTNTRGVGGIAYVDQSPVVFSGSVLENISAFGDGDAIARALSLSHQLGVERIIHRLPLGYNTLLQDSAELTHNRSFMQGVSLVQALTLRPKILLLDHATAAMDKPTKGALLHILANLKGEMTLVFTSKDTALLSLADYTIDLTPERDTSGEWFPQTDIDHAGTITGFHSTPARSA